jgi:hypothetical protein
MTRLGRFYRSLFYRESTHFLLDHLTMRVKDKEIAEEIRYHRLKQINRAVPILGILSVVSIF